MQKKKKNRREGDVKTGRYRSEAGISKGMLAATRVRKKQEMDSVLKLLDEVWPCQCLSLGLVASRTIRINFHSCKLLYK